MDELEELKQAIIAQIKARVPVQTVWATCKSTNVNEGTMVATREGLDYDDVLLGIGDDITVPKPNSKVLLGLVENHGTATFLLFAEQVQERRINGLAHGGLVIADTVRKADAALLAKMNAMLAALNAWTPTAPPTPADFVTLKAAFTIFSATPLNPVVPMAYENTTVKHG